MSVALLIGILNSKDTIGGLCYLQVIETKGASAMRNSIYIDRYIETCYYRLAENARPVDVQEFNHAFAITELYDSKAPIARSGLCDMFVKESKYSYDSTFFDSLVWTDRYAIVDRVAFFSLMRAVLPSFTLLLNDQTEVDVDAFASIYEDGFCSITYIYNCRGALYNADFGSKIEHWHGIKGIKISKNLWDILKLKNENVPTNPRYFIGVPLEEFFSALGGNDKFLHSMLVITEVLSKSLEKDIESYSIKALPHKYRYYQFSTNCTVTEDIITQTRQIVEEKGAHYLFPPTMAEQLTDISLYRNYRLLLNSNYFLCFRKTCEKFNADILVPFFVMIDHCLLQKSKTIVALTKFKEIEKYADVSVNDLFELKSSLISTIDCDLVYDFLHLNEGAASRTIWNCIHSDQYIEELEKVYARIEKEITTREQRNRERQQRRFDTRIQIITLILTIPSVDTIVDILYQIDINNPIIFPIGITKAICIIATMITSFIVLRDKNNGPKKQ